MNIAIPVIIVVAIGFVAAAVLVFASRVFAVEVDETAVAISDVLPGANCGGCGYAGCNDYAGALAADHSLPCNKCAVGGAAVTEKIALILGVAAGDEEKEVAVVMCNGVNSVVRKLMDYTDYKSCKASKSFFGGMNACAFGCIGLGDCVNACQFDAIHVRDGVAWVDRSKCTSCGACAKACPNNLIRISPEKNLVFVRCSNKEKGAVAMKACRNACIGCKKCQNACKFDAVHVENNLSYIDPELCRNCGMCEKACPTGAIVNMRLVAKYAENSAQSVASVTSEQKSAGTEADA
jgi:Na+-translocating ferredoxin:NAD+ oxidoreductase RNF subunit RnfB